MLLNAIPREFRLIRINLDIRPDSIPMKFSMRRCLNQYLDTSKSYKDIKHAYKKGLMYSIRKAERKCVRIRSDLNPSDLILFSQNHRPKNYRFFSKYKSRLLALMKNAVVKNEGEIWGAYDSRNRLISAGLTISNSETMHYIYQVNSALGKELCASHLMTDYIVQKACKQVKKLDFVGSNVPGIAFFNSQFGCKQEHYYSLSYGSKGWSHCLKKTICEFILS